MTFGVPRSAFRDCALLSLVLSAPSRIAAQASVIGPIDFYGVTKVSRDSLRAHLGLKTGDSVPGSAEGRAAVEQRLGRVPGVTRARLEPVCCDADRYILFVGIEEAGAKRLTFAAPPKGGVRVADTLRTLSEGFITELFEGLKAGKGGDDLSQGHSLMEYPPARAIQEELLRYAGPHEAELKTVLRQSADPESRAIAAWALGYAPDKHTVIFDLVAAARDPYPETRNNAVRALVGIGTLAQKRPELGLEVPAAPMLRLLDSPVWTDRNKSSYALMALTLSRDPALLRQLRREAMVPLLEMARWQSAGHALPSFLVVARVVGVSDSAAFAMFQAGEREKVLVHAEH